MNEKHQFELSEIEQVQLDVMEMRELLKKAAWQLEPGDFRMIARITVLYELRLHEVFSNGRNANFEM